MNESMALVENLSRLKLFENLSPAMQTALFLSLLAFVPALLVSLTAYTRVVIVLSFARRAVTAQDIPPTIVITGLSLFVTLFIMGPTLDEINEKAVTPYLNKEISKTEALEHGLESLREFMLRQTREDDLALFYHLSKASSPKSKEEIPLRILVPSFIISELKTAFIMGFCIYLPFLLVDLVVASILTSLGMITLPPVIISAPFKILLFVLANGWHLIIYALGGSFA